MKRLVVTVACAVFVASTMGAVSCQRNSEPGPSRQRLLSAFLTCLPDSLDDQRRDEISALFDNFFVHVDRGDVDPKDVEEITNKVERYVELGAVSADSLVYLMAQVGYYTYKLDPRKNLTTGEVDHPILNPAASSMQIRPDSAFWAEFEEWKRTHVTQQGDTVIIKVDRPSPR